MHPGVELLSQLTILLQNPTSKSPILYTVGFQFCTCLFLYVGVHNAHAEKRLETSGWWILYVFILGGFCPLYTCFFSYSMHILLESEKTILF